MAEQSVNASKTSHKQLSNSDYRWEYEYYDYAPVSFEGLKAHKYSIVIGFWVGLAVFVIFMFFVLTLLTKTGAPHQENVDLSEKRFQSNRFGADFGRTLEADRIFFHQEVGGAMSLFHSFINEADQSDRAKSTNRSVDNGIVIHQHFRKSTLEEDSNVLERCNLPNFVSSDHNSSLAEEELLIYDPPSVLENEPACRN
ncbi:melanocortin-2 receptor accessory protein 2 [Hyla sarda]|uniref:melanocortin-2 receptor accessory protein 2 n=1 Tax=Hyla sarda TaxID=327740 RepID=UPI0024C24FC7|nr:melanocortin-2 receptor accessory protein 2 [Hyla sarda]XP_056421993.1 melanocortin-2 receptor accessory protein 2 [Hyla sarda]